MSVTLQLSESKMTETKYGDVTVAVKDYVGCVEIHRPPHNFFRRSTDPRSRQTRSMHWTKMRRAVCRCCAPRVKSFCAGANFAKSKREPGVEPGAEKRNPLLFSEAVRLFSCKKPMIGAIPGSGDRRRPWTRVGAGLSCGLARGALRGELCQDWIPSGLRAHVHAAAVWSGYRRRT